MKFISKFANYRIVLRPGIPGNRAVGTQAVPGLYVKFESGIAEIKNEETIELMKKHPAFLRGDIMTPEDGVTDPFAGARKDSEPVHNMVNIEYGHVGKNINPKPPTKLNADQMKAIKSVAAELAVNMVKELLPKAVEQEIANRAEEVPPQPAPITSQPIQDPEPVAENKDPRLIAPEPIEDENVYPDDVVEATPLKIVKEPTKVGGEEIGKIEEITEEVAPLVDAKELEPVTEPVAAPTVEPVPETPANNTTTQIKPEPIKRKPGRPKTNK